MTKRTYISPSLTAVGHSNGLSHEKDPRGLVRADVETLRRTFKRQPVSPKNTIEEIMYQAGQQSVIDYIEQQIAPRYS